MTLHLTIPQQTHTDFTPRITVIGVGGGGTNAVDNMIALNLQGVDFVVANTDAQQLVHSKADRRIQLGPHITQGLGAGAKPEIGRAAAEEAAEELYRHLDGAHMVFITAGMGGGTGTGAAPVIARMARERNILTVGVVTKPFTFEGARRARAADAGIDELQQFVDTLIVIPNQNLFRLANERTGWKEAFKMADNVLYMGVRGVTDLMVAPGLVNLDFADIRTVMAEMGKAMMGTGEAEGENRAVRAAEVAISNPLLEDTSMAGARGLLINITGGEDMTLFEVDQAANRIREEVDEEANIIFGSAIDESLAGRIRVSVVATGIESPAHRAAAAERPRLVAVAGGAPLAVPTGGPGGGIGGGIGGPLSADLPPLAELPAHLAAAAPAAAPALPRGFTMQAATPAASVARPASPRPVLPIARLQAAAHAVPATHAGPAAAAPAPRPALQSAAPAAPAAAAEVVDPAFLDEHSDPAGHAGIEAAPVRPGARPASGARSGNGLFAEPKAGEPAPLPAAPRKSLFGIVTGAIKGGALAAGQPHEAGRGEAAAPRAEPVLSSVRAHQGGADPQGARMRQTTGEEMGIEIPAFLRRQSS